MTNPVVLETVPGTPFADLAREFDAPVAAVFRAHADPDRFARWIGPRGLTTTVPQWDFRTGGGYAFEQRTAAGEIAAFRGVFHTVVPDALIIQTFEYAGAPGEVSLERMRFEALPGSRCRLVARSVFTSTEALEGMIAHGMEHGVDEGYRKLDELLAEAA
jgi:uncharacterized protein YndB with AHSA1/START domain